MAKFYSAKDLVAITSSALRHKLDIDMAGILKVVNVQEMLIPELTERLTFDGYKGLASRNIIEGILDKLGQVGSKNTFEQEYRELLKAELEYLNGVMAQMYHGGEVKILVQVHLGVCDGPIIWKPYKYLTLENYRLMPLVISSSKP